MTLHRPVPQIPIAKAGSVIEGLTQGRTRVAVAEPEFN